MGEAFIVMSAIFFFPRLFLAELARVGGLGLGVITNVNDQDSVMLSREKEKKLCDSWQDEDTIPLREYMVGVSN